MLALDQSPRVEAPTKSPDRLAQLRTYESHSAERAMKKIQMFNEGGEIAIFRRVGMRPVFFGQTLIGSKLPNLTYMLAFDNEQAMTTAWNGFRGTRTGRSSRATRPTSTPSPTSPTWSCGRWKAQRSDEARAGSRLRNPCARIHSPASRGHSVETGFADGRSP